MAFKSSRDTFPSPNKNNESESEEQKGESSQKTQESKNKSKASKKKDSKQSSPKYLTTPSTSAVTQYVPPTRLPLVPVIPAMIPVPNMTPYFQYPSPRPNYPVQEWCPVSTAPVQSPMYNMPFQPVPVVMAPQVLAPICPYSGAMISQPILSPVVPQPVVIEELPPNYIYDNVATFSPEQTVPTATFDNYPITQGAENLIETTFYETADPWDIYFRLPSRLFPKARRLSFNPNPIIDEFCRVPNIHIHAPWIMDLEFGVPRVAVTRPIAIYDVKFNRVYCKNAPCAIHPGFESCNQKFKNVLLFNYDCAVSTWYRGYVQMSPDSSMENFQCWLQRPMQMFGMCWP